MKMGVKETLCTKCSHLAVCKYVEDMEMAILQTDKINIDIVNLIKVSVSCSEYRQNSGNTR